MLKIAVKLLLLNLNQCCNIRGFMCLWSFLSPLPQLMELEGLVSLDCCRLVKYDEFHEYLERSYEGEEETPMGLLLGGVKSSYMFDLLLETRRPDQVFQPYKPGG